MDTKIPKDKHISRVVGHEQFNKAAPKSVGKEEDE